MPVVGWEVGNPSDPNDRKGEEQAKIALHALLKTYPGYSWVVQLRGGAVIIRNYSLDWRGRWAMVLHLKDIHHDHKVFRTSVLRAAGEFLERAHQRRGPMLPGSESNPVLEGAQLIGAARWSPKPKAESSPIGIVGEE